MNIFWINECKKKNKKLKHVKNRINASLLETVWNKITKIASVHQWSIMNLMQEAWWEVTCRVFVWKRLDWHILQLTGELHV